MPDGVERREIAVRRVLHVTPYIHPAAGGPPVVVERWAECASALGSQARVLSTPALSTDGGRGLLAEAAGRYDLTMVKSALDALWGDGRAVVRGLVQEADVVHLHTMWSPLNAIVARVCRQIGRPYVVSPHGMLDPYSLGIKSFKKRAYLKMVESRILQNAAGVLFTAEDERDLAVAQVGQVPNAGVVGLGADTPSASREELRDRFRSMYPALADRKLVIFLGRLHPKKRPDALIRAMAGVIENEPSAALLMAGGGDPGYVSELKHISNTLGIRERVHFLGHLTGDAKWGALAASSVFALPSLQENFAIAAAEALQLGLPVLITDRINIWREIVTAGAGVMLREAELESDIVSITTALLSDPNRRHDMGSRARALAMRCYTWPASARMLSAYYDAVLAPPRAIVPGSDARCA